MHVIVASHFRQQKPLYAPPKNISALPPRFLQVHLLVPPARKAYTNYPAVFHILRLRAPHFPLREPYGMALRRTSGTNIPGKRETAHFPAPLITSPLCLHPIMANRGNQPNHHVMLLKNCQRMALAYLPIA